MTTVAANRATRNSERYLDAALNALRGKTDGLSGRVVALDGRAHEALVMISGWVKYSSRESHHRTCKYFVVRDSDSGDYRALRVGPGVTTLAAAREYVMPAAVRRAAAAGKPIIRQGDFYFVPARKWALDDTARTNHTVVLWVTNPRSRGSVLVSWRPGKPINGNGCIVEHPTHRPVVLATPHRAYQQIVVHQGGFGGRVVGRAD